MRGHQQQAKQPASRLWGSGRGMSPPAHERAAAAAAAQQQAQAAENTEERESLYTSFGELEGNERPRRTSSRDLPSTEPLN